MGKSVEVAEGKYYFNNRDLLIISVLSGIGGVMSTYVGYLGNLLNRVFGVPFGAGQFVAGLHVFWLLLVAGLIRRPGAATAAGLLKGIIELLTGSTHGVAIILVSLVQGIAVDLVLLFFRRHSLMGYVLAGAVAAATNVFVFQLLYFSGAPVVYILFIAMLSLISGGLLGGSFAHNILGIVLQARPLRITGSSIQGETAGIGTGFLQQKRSRLSIVVTMLLVLVLSVGAVYYYVFIFDLPWVGPQCQVEGAVEKPLSFQLSTFEEHTTTIVAELRGEVTYVPPQEYTGVLLRVILAEAQPKLEAKTLRITATDGYAVELDLQDVLQDDKLLLIEENDTLRLIAGNYPGGYWVKQVNRIVVE